MDAHVEIKKSDAATHPIRRICSGRIRAEVFLHAFMGAVHARPLATDSIATQRPLNDLRSASNRRWEG